MTIRYSQPNQHKRHDIPTLYTKSPIEVEQKVLYHVVYGKRILISTFYFEEAQEYVSRRSSWLYKGMTIIKNCV